MEVLRRHLKPNELGSVKGKNMERRLDRSAGNTSESERVELCEGKKNEKATG